MTCRQGYIFIKFKQSEKFTRITKELVVKMSTINLTIVVFKLIEKQPKLKKLTNLLALF